MSDDDRMADIIERLHRAAPFLRSSGYAGIVGQHANTCDEAADEIRNLRVLLSAYVADETRYNRGEGEPYGSIATETGMRARAATAQ